MHKNLIAGEWVAAVRTRSNINPSETRDVVGEYAQADAAQARGALLRCCERAACAGPVDAAAAPSTSLTRRRSH